MSEHLIRAATTGTELCYETLGAPEGPPILLIMGLGTQMIAWPDDFCRDLAARGNFVIRFDNRDVGHSTHFNHLGAPDPIRSLLRRAQPVYRLDDMASDAVGLLDALGIGSAHVVGASMGGFIAQILAVGNPGRLRSLGLIMTSTGARRVGRPRARVIAKIGRRRRMDADRESAISLVLDVARVIGSPGYPFDEAHLRDLAGRGYDRAYDPSGYLRQMAAIMSQGDRTAALRSIAVPTVVIHGLADPLVNPSGGRAIARAIPGSRFVGLAGMGHDLPKALWPRIADEIALTVAEGESRREGAGTGSTPPSTSRGWTAESS
ncbi:MAG: alpha/beta fold hydrolase [Acidimicrobiales bacterium]|jgi:pimeloyl-ACP methyl ester carboxylesterase